MKLNKVEFDTIMTGIELSKVDDKDLAIRQSQMIAYAIGKKKPKWYSDFGNSQSERMEILYGEEYVQGYYRDEAIINQKLSEMVSDIEYPEFD